MKKSVIDDFIDAFLGAYIKQLFQKFNFFLVDVSCGAERSNMEYAF